MTGRLSQAVAKVTEADKQVGEFLKGIGQSAHRLIHHNSPGNL